MKKFIALAAALLSVSSFALSEADSWDTIKSEVKNNWKLQLSGYAVFVGQVVHAFDVCVDGDEFKTTKQYPVYETKYVGKTRDNDGDNDGWTSVVVGYRTLSFPITYTTKERVCNNRDKNCKYVSKVVEQETVKKMTVKKFVRSVGRNNDRDVYKTLFTKEYEIPACN